MSITESLRTLQAEHRSWLAREYPNQVAEMPAAGLVEEAGELMHAVLKAAQENVWGRERRYDGVSWGEEVVDAIGDCAVYFCSLCNANGWDFASMMVSALSCNTVEAPASQFAVVAVLVQKAVHVALSARVQLVAHDFLVHLARVSVQFNVGLVSAVHSTWRTVRCRSRTSPSSST